jgi:hypothetical protein
MKNWNYLLRTLVLAAIVALVAYSSWRLRLGMREFFAEKDQRIEQLSAQLAQRDGRIATLKDDVETKQRQIAQLEAALRLLKVDHRIARLEVLGQQADAADRARQTTTVRFAEIGPEGEPVGEPQEFTLDGTKAYIEASVIKFDDRYVEQGDALRGTSIVLFRRLFGEHQQPSEGFPLDASGSRPAAYSRGSAASDFEQRLWRDFWDYANDAGKAQAAGVRAAHDEAPSIELRPGMTYRIELRASDGLSIRPE